MKLTRLWLLLTLIISGCETAGNKYFCPPEKAYDATGKVVTSRYQVDVDCYKSMTAKQKACYKEAQ